MATSQASAPAGVTTRSPRIIKSNIFRSSNLGAAIAAHEIGQFLYAFPLLTTADRFLDMRNPVRRKHCACKLVEFRAQFRLFEWLLEITAMALASMDALPAILQSERYSRRPQARCHCAHRRIFGDMNAVAQSGDNGVGQRCIVECGITCTVFYDHSRCGMRQ